MQSKFQTANLVIMMLGTNDVNLFDAEVRKIAHIFTQQTHTTNQPQSKIL